MPDEPRVDLTALRARRFARVREMMAGLGIDHLVLTGVADIRYVTDFRAQLVSEADDWYAAVVNLDGEADIMVPYVDEDQPPPPEAPEGVRMLRPLPSWAPAVCHPRTWAAAIGRVLARGGARKVGFDRLDAAVLDAAPLTETGVEMRPLARELLRLREIKDEDEVLLLEAACRANRAALEATVDRAVPGVTDHDLLAHAAEGRHAAGVEFLVHGVCNSGQGSGSWFADGTRVADGLPFFLDIGCYGVGGYASDLARTGVIGDVPEQVSRAYRRLLNAYEEGREQARPGVRCSTIHEAINTALVRQGMPPTPYATGHGIGLRVGEPPTIHRADLMDEDAVLRPGHVIALEPETTVEMQGRRFVLKVEDNFVVEAGGLRPLAPTAPAFT